MIEKVIVVVGLYLDPPKGAIVLSVDEKSQLQALARRHDTVAAAPGRPALVEFELQRGGTLAYLAAWGPPRRPVPPLRAQDRDRAVRPPRRTGDEQRALRVGQDGVLDRRQRQASDEIPVAAEDAVQPEPSSCSASRCSVSDTVTVETGLAGVDGTSVPIGSSIAARWRKSQFV